MDEHTYESALDALFSSLHQSSTKEAIAAAAARRTRTVQDMRVYLRRANISVPTLTRIIHITGTKGKGSTACFCESIMRKRYGMCTGLFTSPHLVHIQERIRVNGKPISPESFGRAYWTVRRRLESATVVDGGRETGLPRLPGYFRMLTLMSLFTFSNYDPSVNVIILEVGMGGRYDATNVLDHSDYMTCCGVTQLDLDHIRVLGNTVEQIAWEKGGIFAVEKESTRTSQRPGRAPIIFGEISIPSTEHKHFALDSNTASSLDVLKQCALVEGCGGVLQLVRPNHDPKLPPGCSIGLQGPHQRGNAELAIALCESIAERSASIMDSGKDNLLDAIAIASWPGRCQTFKFRENLTIRLDGAHTPQSFLVGFNWFRSITTSASREKFKNILVFNCSHERNPVELLEMLDCQMFSSAYFARADSERPSAVSKALPQDLLQKAGRVCHSELLPTTGDRASWQATLESIWKHQVKESQSEEMTTSSGLTCSEVIADIGESLSPVQVFVCGSLYLVGSMLQAVGWSEPCAVGEVAVEEAV